MEKITPLVAQNRQASYEVDPLFLNRWSPRSFADKEVPEDVLLGIFEAARWAPSGNNAQPWRFIVARTQEDRAKFHGFISAGNLEWCVNAPVLALVMSKTVTERGALRTHAFDTGAAWGYLALEAVNKGLMTHPMGGFDRDKARTQLHVPGEYELHAVVAIGYQGDKAALPDNLQEREKPSARRPLMESLFEGDFGQSLKQLDNYP